VLEAEAIVKANFYDLDPMEVVWHGNYVRFLEDARCALLDRINFNYDEMRDAGFMWPIVDMRVKYVRPIRFNQKVRVVARLVEYENRLRLDYRIYDMVTGEVLTKAETIQVAVDLGTQEMQFESPPVLVEKIKKFL
jgi:acyl-CoA thioester hydrolase